MMVGDLTLHPLPGLTRVSRNGYPARAPQSAATFLELSRTGPHGCEKLATAPTRSENHDNWRTPGEQLRRSPRNVLTARATAAQLNQQQRRQRHEVREHVGLE